MPRGGKIGALADTEDDRRDSLLIKPTEKKKRKRVGESEKIFVPIRLTHEQWAILKKAQISTHLSLQEMGILGFSLALKQHGIEDLFKD